MCGRYAFFMPPEMLKSRLGLEHILNIPPRYNCAPMQDLPIVVKGRMGFARWGFRPGWARQDDPAMAVKMINARSESVAEKAAFRESWFKARRCLIPASGFYEWAKNEAGVSQPYYIAPQNNDLLLFAGLWSKVDEQVSFTILTKAADENLQHLHHRSPVMIDESAAQEWFGGDVECVQALMAHSTTRILDFHAVGVDVGKVSNDYPDLITPMAAEKATVLL